MNAATLLALAGGLGLFLLGMSMMSESIEKAAGAKLRGILEFFTKNKFMGMIVGIVFTGIIQSSSACTVMVVSFVNSGLINLYQAAGVIFGANIGTTVTSQLVSFNLSKYAPIFLLLGVLFVMFCKKQGIVKIAAVFVGFGVLFTGLSSMSSAMSGMSSDPTVISILSSLKSPLLAILVGAVLTAIIQSSSVTVSILLLMCKEGLLGLDIALFVILGCNIGACTSALLASAAGKKDAKRAAMIHFLFNVIGTVIMYVILKIFEPGVIQILYRMPGGDDMGRCIANAHTLFKVFQVIILFPFSKYIVKMTYLVVPGEDAKVGYRDNFQLKYIGDKVVFNPATAVVDGIKELERMASLASENLNRSMNALVTLDEEDIKEVYAVEDNINFLNKEITKYLVKINQMTLPIEDVKSLGSLFHVASDIERIGDHAVNIAEMAESRKETGVKFSQEAMKEMGEMLDMVNTLVRFSIEMFYQNSEEHLNDVIQLEDAVDEKERELQKAHVDRLARQECTPEAGMIFSDVASGLERIADHATNIAFSILSEELLEVAKGHKKQIEA